MMEVVRSGLGFHSCQIHSTWVEEGKVPGYQWHASCRFALVENLQSAGPVFFLVWGWFNEDGLQTRSRNADDLEILALIHDQGDLKEQS